GKVHQLVKLRGKTVHLAFFALWCPPCLEQLTRVELADARLRGRGYAGIAIGLKERESAEDLRALATQRTLAFPVAYDARGDIASAFGVSAVPAHVVISPDGTIIFRGRDLPAG